VGEFESEGCGKGVYGGIFMFGDGKIHLSYLNHMIKMPPQAEPWVWQSLVILSLSLSLSLLFFSSLFDL